MEQQRESKVACGLKCHRQPVSFARLCCCYCSGNRIGLFASETHVREKRDDGRKSFIDITANSADTDCEEQPVNRYGDVGACRR